MFDRLFRAHPRSVNESYAEHFGVAVRFGGAMLVGALGAFVHALIPALCVTTGSRTVKRLNARLDGRGTAPAEDRAAEARAAETVH